MQPAGTPLPVPLQPGVRTSRRISCPAVSAIHGVPYTKPTGNQSSNLKNIAKYCAHRRAAYTVVKRRYPIKAQIAESGIVTTHAVIIPRTTFQLTAFFPLVTPTPIIAPLITWVEETGIPYDVTMDRVALPAVAAQNPWYGRIFVISFAILSTTFQPPKHVPR